MALAFIAATSGGAGAALASCVLYPLDVVKTHLNRGADQRGEKYHGPVDVLRRVLKEKGLAGLYAGMSTRTTHQVLQKFSFYYVYDGLGQVARVLVKAKDLSFAVSLAVGYVAGLGTVVIANPLEVASTRTPGLIATLVRMTREEGPMVFYKGGLANLVLSINPAIENAFFDRIKTLFLERRGARSLTLPQAFWLGALAKIIATAFTFPFIRAKVIIQAGKKKAPKEGQDAAGKDSKQVALKSPAGESSSLTTLQVIRDIISDDGVMALWLGMGTQSLKSVLSSAILLSVKEKVEAIVRAAVLAIIKGRK
ncbi:unnamed protein product [Polarella glacialis]|uniref:ADP,ATP carrier protein n=1 Tax=Polarella glacialis TaxID=89957 RepID=A0A813E4R0_POLGL|nr:unnamed protein product [Polarella glacialis]